MTREEEIKIYLKERNIPFNSLEANSIIEGAQWADETMIEKAEKWLEHFLEKTIQKPSINDGYTSDTIMYADYKRRKLIKDVLYDFKKAMELCI